MEHLEIVVADDFNAVMARLEGGGLWTVAAIDYELGYLLEPRSAPPDWRPSGRPLASFWCFSEREALSAEVAEQWLADQAQLAGVFDCQPGMDEKSYCAAVDRIQAYISAGDCYQVNYTFPLQFNWFGTPLALYAKLRQRQPVRYGGFVGDAQQGLVSLSPELFLEKRGKRLLTRPMKGTAPRHLPQEALSDSIKDRAENLMIVDLLRNDLGRVAENGSVRVDSLFSIEDYPTVWQMVSEVSATLGEVSLGDILRALFPCGSITGAPKIRAMQIAAELEPERRGVYTGALGWLAPNGDFRLNVAIRTLELGADFKGKMGIGSGIVADSVAGAEWRECLLKASFLSAADPGILLIETLRLETGAFPRLAGHLARLQASATRLGFVFDDKAVLAALADLPGEGRWRVRLTLSRGGEVKVAAFSLADEPAGPRWAIWSAQTIDSTYPLRQFKTTDRAIYDQALTSIADQPAIFDVLFINERGEVAEGARSNVFVERDGCLLTPPLASGALPGVLRAELLASGRAREAVLRPADLAGGFLLGNALRGLVPVNLRSTA